MTNGPVTTDERLRRVAADVFGWPELREQQVDAMTALMAGRDAFVVMPTGAGKSAVYQVPAVLLDGLTVVVSPLIALQRDQVTALGETGAPQAVCVNSAQSEDDNRAAWDAVRDGSARYLFVSPEQVVKPEVAEALAGVRTALFTVDEAHCVSAWGHDFRPDYLRLAGVVDRLGRPPVLALTATAGPQVRADVVAHLGMRDPLVVVAGFDRPNLRLEVRFHTDEDDKRREVVRWVEEARKPGLLYVATRRDAERYAGALTDAGVRADAYHAGMKAADRRSAQDAFMADEVDVVVATSAFGMGIDKPNVRFVAHVSPPASLDAYYQEIGRAGRDDEPAEAVLFYRPEELGLQRFLTSRHVDRDGIVAVAAAIRAAERPRVADLVERTGQSRRKVASAVNLLDGVGAVTGRRGGLRWTGSTATDAADRAVAEADRLHRLDLSRIEMLREYAETRGCRRVHLLGYFGQVPAGPCGNCDTCASGAVDPADAPGADADFAVASGVRHTEWGPGTVVRTETDRLTVLFEQVGYKTLSLSAVADGDLLTPDPVATGVRSEESALPGGGNR